MTPQSKTKALHRQRLCVRLRLAGRRGHGRLDSLPVAREPRRRRARRALSLNDGGGGKGGRTVSAVGSRAGRGVGSPDGGGPCLREAHLAARPRASHESSGGPSPCGALGTGVTRSRRCNLPVTKCRPQRALPKLRRTVSDSRSLQGDPDGGSPTAGSDSPGA